MMIDTKGIAFIALLLAIIGAILGMAACAIWHLPLWFILAGVVAFPVAILLLFLVAIFVAVITEKIRA